MENQSQIKYQLEKEKEKETQIKINQDLISKKRFRLEDIISKNKNFGIEKKEKNSNSNSNSDSDSELDNYKNIISGKLNIEKLVSNRNKINDLMHKEKLQSTIDEEKLRKNNKKNYLQNKNNLSFLPNPENKNIDKSKINHLFYEEKDLENENNFFNDFKSNLINPDSDIIDTNNNNINNKNNFNNDFDQYSSYEKINGSNVVNLAVNDLIDKDWEMKYTSKMQKKDLVYIFHLILFYLFILFSIKLILGKYLRIIKKLTILNL